MSFILLLYYFADQPTQNNFPHCPYNKKLSCLCLSGIIVKEKYVYCNIFANTCWKPGMQTLEKDMKLTHD